MKIFLLALLALGTVLLRFDIFLAAVILLLFFVLCIRYKNNLGAKETSIYVLVFLAFFVQTHYSIKNHTSKLANKENTEVVLTITNPIIINGDYLKTKAIVEEENVEVSYKLNTKEEKLFFQKEFYGGQIKVIADIEDIKEKKNFYSFDYKDYQEKHGVYKSVIIKEIKASKKEVQGFLNKFNLLRAKLIKDIDNNLVFNESGYFQALIFGEKSSLSEEDKDNFSKLGISHLLAISGLHIATLLSIIYFLTNKLSISKNVREKILLFILPIYCILAGFSPSVIRATAMVLAFILLKKFSLKGIEAILIVFVSMIFINPYYIYDIGFQFSFFTSFSLLMSSHYINSSSNKYKKVFKVAVIAGVSSMPIALYYFYSYSYISIITNMIFVPYFTLIIFPAVLVSYVIFLINAELFKIVSQPILNFIFYINEKLIDIFSYFTYSIKLGETNRIYIYTLVLIVCVFLITLNKKKYKISVFIASLILCLPQIGNVVLKKKESIEEINLNGKTIYYIRSNKEKILINTSNSQQEYYNDFRKKIKEYDIMKQYQSLLDYEGIKKFDYLVLSKTSSKDIGQAANLIANEKIKKVLVLEEIKDDKNIKAIIEVAKIKNVEYDMMRQGTYKIGGVNLVYENKEFSVSLSDTSYKINGEK